MASLLFAPESILVHVPLSSATVTLNLRKPLFERPKGLVPSSESILFKVGLVLTKPDNPNPPPLASCDPNPDPNPDHFLYTVVIVYIQFPPISPFTAFCCCVLLCTAVYCCVLLWLYQRKRECVSTRGTTCWIPPDSVGRSLARSSSRATSSGVSSVHLFDLLAAFLLG